MNLWLGVKCCVCKKEFETGVQIISYYKAIEGCRITKAVCEECSKKTKSLWDENKWIKLEK